MILAAIPFAALQVDRATRAVLRVGAAWLVLVLLVAAVVPLAIEGARQQPIGESVDGLRDGLSGLSGWVRMSGRIVTLTAPENLAAGRQVQSLLIEPSGDAIMLLSQRTLEDEASVTGRISSSANADVTARRVGGPRLPDEELDIIDRYVLSVDAELVPPAERSWALAWVPAMIAAFLAVGLWVRYPVVRLNAGRRAPGGARPLAVGETMRLRVVEPELETGLRLRAPRGLLRRLEPRRDTDPYFSLQVEGRERPLEFRRHRWSTAAPGRLWTVLEAAPVVELRDWGIEVLLALDSEADRDRVLASFAVDGSGGDSRR